MLHLVLRFLKSTEAQFSHLTHKRCSVRVWLSDGVRSRPTTRNVPRGTPAIGVKPFGGFFVAKISSWDYGRNVMKKIIPAVCLIAVFTLFGIGCATLSHNASQQSPPVALGAADTNTPNAVAWLQLASALNKEANPTPTQEPISVALTALTTLVSAGLGWYARHTSSKADATTASTTTTSTKT